MSLKKIFNTKVFIMLLLSVFLLGTTAGCGSSPNSTDGKAAKEKIVFGDVSWASIQVHNRIAAYITEHGYGYDVDYVFGDTIPTLQGMGDGEIDVLMEVWVDNYEKPWTKLLDQGKVEDLGFNFPDAPQGWYVPTYMIKGDPERGIEAVAPDLKSVNDLPKYWELFKDPEKPDKGRFHQAPPGWVVNTVNEEKFYAYGLDKTFNLFSTGSQSALDASMVSAYDKGESWVGYYWEPTWIMGKLDMTKLEEVEYSEEKWEQNHACAFPNARVIIGVNSNLSQKAPDVYEFLKKYDTTLEQNNSALAYMKDNDNDVEAAAIWFLKEYEDVWTEWVTEDAAQKVKADLGEVK